MYQELMKTREAALKELAEHKPGEANDEYVLALAKLIQAINAIKAYC